ncbi:hypothetical protein AAKU55_000517 [Oxalobacteraceae bacterium GrIS 1.11]
MASAEGAGKLYAAMEINLKVDDGVSLLIIGGISKSGKCRLSWPHARTSQIRSVAYTYLWKRTDCAVFGELPLSNAMMQ